MFTGALSNFLLSDLLWSPAATMASQFSELKKNKRNFTLELHCAIYTIDLFSVHTRCPPEIVFCFFFGYFCFLIVADFSKKTLELQNTLPLFKTWIPSRPPISLKLLGKICKEEEAAVELCMRQTVLKSDTGYTTMHTSSLRATATPNRDWNHSGIGWSWVSGTIPNKRGFS